jgi:hypothetical protein
MSYLIRKMPIVSLSHIILMMSYNYQLTTINTLVLRLETLTLKNASNLSPQQQVRNLSI